MVSLGFRSNTSHLRDFFGLTQKEISLVFGVPLRTIQNWDYRDCMPAYLDLMMADVLIYKYHCFEHDRAGNLEKLRFWLGDE